MTYVRFRISEGGVCTIKMVEYSYIHNQIKPPPPFMERYKQRIELYIKNLNISQFNLVKITHNKSYLCPGPSCLLRPRHIFILLK